MFPKLFLFDKIPCDLKIEPLFKWNFGGLIFPFIKMKARIYPIIFFSTKPYPQI